ncbi:MAG: L,D-transpeptidase [Verrucomicrobiota bacterium]|nr:L,D-transpeptidase [Verrucomicrobiota bacterium]
MAKKSISISIPKQQLNLKNGRATVRTFLISSSRFGVGSKEGSLKTPVGKFRIAEKIGAGLPHDIAFKSRRPLRATKEMLRADDLIMSRILWLDGLERRNANSHERYIYIHGTNHEETIGRPDSHGCIRMKNAEVAELFEMVEVGTSVVITSRKRKVATRKKARKALRRRSSLPK